jgi:hypothetical protein
MGNRTSSPDRTNSMNDLSYFECWSLWFQGHTLQDKVLWGMSILWWGRLGRIVGLVSALAVLAEIIGPQRLRETGTQLRQLFQMKKLTQMMSYTIRSCQAAYEFFARDPSQSGNDSNLSVGTTLGAMLVVAYFFFAGIVYLLWVFNYLNVWWVVFWICVAIGVPAILTAAIMLALGLLLLFQVLLIEPFARLLEQETVGNIVKCVSLHLLLIGFHFDLLSS